MTMRRYNSAAIIIQLTLYCCHYTASLEWLTGVNVYVSSESDSFILEIDARVDFAVYLQLIKGGCVEAMGFDTSQRSQQLIY